MRTTIVIDDLFEAKLKHLASRRELSLFVNQCLQEHFRREASRKRLLELEQAYARAAGRGKKGQKEFDAADIEDWPEW